nr:type IA DNA topoisomerase [Sulfobacillus harzensis]
MKPLGAYDHLAAAAKARAEADWLVGLNATRAFSLRHGRPGSPLSVGRVQTPTLRLIADRDREIIAFTPVPYWQVAVTFQATQGAYVGLWQGSAKEHPDRIMSLNEAQAILAPLTPGTRGQILSLETKRVTLKPPLLYSLNDLQKDANRRLGMTAQQTLDAAQRLYDQHLVTYPRTDSRYLTGDVAATVTQRLRGVGQWPAYQDLVEGVPRPLRTRRLVNEADVNRAGHHAIIPTGSGSIGSLAGRDAALFDLIARRFLAALYPAGLDDRTTLITEAASHRFKTTGVAVVEAGWRGVLKPAPASDSDADEAEGAAIPPGLVEGQAVNVDHAEIRARETKAPPRLSDASLLALMEKHGLGTPATRARILELLLARDYVMREKKTLQSTEKGRQLLEVLPETIQSPELTGRWERSLEGVAEGQEDPDHFLHQIRSYTKELVETARTQQGARVAEEDLGACPVCQIGRVVGNAKGWGCSRWREGCSFMIWRTVAGKKLTPAQVKTLMAGKTTATLKGFKSKSGKSFQARLKYSQESGRIEFVFQEKSPAKRRRGKTQAAMGAKSGT